MPMRYLGWQYALKQSARARKAKEEFREKSFLRKLGQYQRHMLLNPSSLELKVAAILDEENITYISQEIIGKYIVDFCIRKKGLKKIIEADGIQHENEDYKKCDIKRDEELGDLGYEVLRIKSKDFSNRDALRQKIKDFIAE